MSENKIIKSIENNLTDFSDVSSVAMIIRHAERGIIPENESGFHVNLTDKGENDSIKFGEEVNKILRKSGFDLDIYTSPVPRCLNTAENIIKGTDREILYKISSYLGDPGVYISDDTIAGEAFLNRNASDVIDEYLKKGEMKGFHKPEEAGNRLLSLISKSLNNQNNFTVHISHDAIIAPFVHHLVGNNSGIIIWPDFLEGMIFIRKNNEITCCFDNRIFKISEV
ncbi:histidine phosphatase family protein [Methanoplanus limicola]|uniref:Phosphoglycerate mutase n=1 Tax=Methanoplanus limicola DSM 2279 TaxID=937775 RepID=H1Z056_9EURY|nr:histidine phosphatase family protein [Methanoplanus limicola]EHQ36148.1 Phosphoglycerate mutase [Methanoplanus limicola DSM 2279]